MRIQAHEFGPRDLVAGHVALDLVNTVTARNADPIDWLDTYSALLGWARLTGAFDQRTLRALEQASTADPRAAARALRRVRELRETVHDVAQPIITGRRVQPATLDRLDQMWKNALAHSRLDIAGGHARPRLTLASSGLDLLTDELALHSVELLRTLPLARARVCPGQRCGWLFIDTSKGGQRRWCDMATCGNLAKASRHRNRVRRAR